MGEDARSALFGLHVGVDMSVFSKQKCFCRACGTELFVALSSPGWVEVCNTGCYEELEWRKTLSTLGEEYYPREVADG